MGLALAVSPGGTGRLKWRPCVIRSEEGGAGYRACPLLSWVLYRDYSVISKHFFFSEMENNLNVG